MINNIISSFTNFIFYSITYMFLPTFRTFNSFNVSFLENQNNILFSQFMVSFWFIIVTGFLLYKFHLKDLNYTKQYLLDFNPKYRKNNRFLLGASFGALTSVPFLIFNIKLLEKYDYLIFLLSFILLVGCFVIIRYLEKLNQKSKKTKLTVLSRFDTIVIFLIMLLCNVIGTVNSVLLIIMYLLWNNYSWRSISYQALIISLINSFIYVGCNYYQIFNFNILYFALSICSIAIAPLTYFAIFKTSDNQKSWFIAITFIFTILFYIIYI